MVCVLLQCEWGMKSNFGRDEAVLQLSTDRPKRSSASMAKLGLAYLIVFALSAQDLHAAAQGERVGQRLAADLTWTQTERDVRFAAMDRMFPVHVVRRGGAVRKLLHGNKLRLPEGVLDAYVSGEHLSGVLVLQDGRILLEKYGLGLTPGGRWTGFSMTKAVTDTLVGVAVNRHLIHSIEDDVTEYLPEMKGSAYDGVSVRQLMTMTSGVGWNENYTAPDADNVKLYTSVVSAGKDSTVEYMRTLHRVAAPGSVWRYNTGETDLLGVLLRRVCAGNLAGFLMDAVWSRAGMAHDATWIADGDGPDGKEFGGSGLSASLEDWGRLGLWVLEGGHGAVAPDWFAQATTPQVKAGGAAYGFGWWPQPDGSFAALGIFGQSMLVDPKRKLVIVTLGDWPEATGAAHSAARAEFWRQVKHFVPFSTGSRP